MPITPEEIIAKYGSQPSEVDEAPEADVPEEQPQEEPKEEKRLSQKDIDKIVEDRLARERKKYADYQDLKEIEENLKEYGYKGSAADIKQQIKDMVAQTNAEKELAELEEEAERTGMSPEILKKIKQQEKVISELQEKISSKEKADKEAEETTKAQRAREQELEQRVTDFKEKYPDVDLEKLASDPKFMKFLKRSGDIPLIDVYEDYVDIVGEAEAQALQKLESKANRSTSSGRSKSDATGGTYGLTPEQQRLARDNKMTYKEYSERLSRIRR